MWQTVHHRLCTRTSQTNFPQSDSDCDQLVLVDFWKFFRIQYRCAGCARSCGQSCVHSDNAHQWNVRHTAYRHVAVFHCAFSGVYENLLSAHTVCRKRHISIYMIIAWNLPVDAVDDLLYHYCQVQSSPRMSWILDTTVKWNNLCIFSELYKIIKLQPLQRDQIF